MTRITQLPPLPNRPADGHKGLFGRVLVVGGSETMIGAPALAGKAALRSGAGLVQVAVAGAILPAVLSITPELIGLGLGGSPDTEKLLEAADKADAVAIGPGLGTSSVAAQRVGAPIRLAKSMVVDADGLIFLQRPAHGRRLSRLTRFSRLTPAKWHGLQNCSGKSHVPSDPDGRIAIAIEAATAFRQVIVLKGSGTVVTDGTRVYINTTGDSSLSKAGTGDVLTGMIGAFLGQHMDRFDAACAATWLQGRAGEIVGQRLGMRCVLAHEVIDALPQASRNTTRPLC